MPMDTLYRLNVSYSFLYSFFIIYFLSEYEILKLSSVLKQNLLCTSGTDLYIRERRRSLKRQESVQYYIISLIQYTWEYGLTINSFIILYTYCTYIFAFSQWQLQTLDLEKAPKNVYTGNRSPTNVYCIS